MSEATSEKKFISADRMEKDCWEFAGNLFNSGLDFDLFVGITRGGAQISFYMQEVFALLSGRPKTYATVHAESYAGIGDAGEVTVENVNGVLRRISAGTNVLLIDDIFDRGKTFRAVYTKISDMISVEDVTVKIAALYYKPENNMVDIVPDYFLRAYKSDDWIVLPHELTELTPEELAMKGFKIP